MVVEVSADLSEDGCNLFLISFVEPVGDIPLLAASNVDSIYAEEISAGYSSIAGTFVVQFGSETTNNLPFDVSVSDPPPHTLTSGCCRSMVFVFGA